MSLAITAASFDSDNNDNYNSLSNDTLINRKKTVSGHNKTQKRMVSSDFNSEKVNSVLNSIHNKHIDDNELGNYQGKSSYASPTQEFKPLNPLEPPNSVGAERTKKQEGMKNMNNDYTVPVPLDNEELNLQSLDSNHMNDAQVRDYYRKLVPNYGNSNVKNYTENNKSYYPSTTTNYQDTENNQVLMEKLNYMINLLEEQQDQKTNNVTEEVVLYSFLGIFIIFVVDSFARVGKYVR